MGARIDSWTVRGWQTSDDKGWKVSMMGKDTVMGSAVDPLYIVRVMNKNTLDKEFYPVSRAEAETSKTLHKRAFLWQNKRTGEDIYVKIYKVFYSDFCDEMPITLGDIVDPEVKRPEQVGARAERDLAETLRELGWWVLLIPRNKAGQQPFDCIAIKGTRVFAFDIKNVLDPSFPLERIEPDQQIAFSQFEAKTDYRAGFALKAKDGDWRWLGWDKILAEKANKHDVKSVRVSACPKLVDVMEKGEAVRKERKR